MKKINHIKELKKKIMNWKKNDEVQKFINELNESRNYVKNLEIPKVMNQMNSYTKNNITTWFRNSSIKQCRKKWEKNFRNK